MWNFKYAKQSDYLYIYLLFSQRKCSMKARNTVTLQQDSVWRASFNAPFQKTCLCQLTNQKGVNVLGSSDVFVI